MSKHFLSSMLWTHSHYHSFVDVGGGISYSTTTYGQLLYYTGRGQKSDSISSIDSIFQDGGCGGGFGSLSLKANTITDKDCDSERNV